MHSKYIGLFLVGQLLLINRIASADEYCTGQENRIKEAWYMEKDKPMSTSRCLSIGGATAVSATSGIYSAKKYSSAKSIETQYTQSLFQTGEHAAEATDFDAISRKVINLTNGDRITIGYQLNERDNRQYHIDLMESRASSSRASAALYGSMALTATKVESETTYNSDGTSSTTTRVVPDYAARASYAALALSEGQKALDYAEKASDARRGGIVPIYDLEKVIESETGTHTETSTFIRDNVQSGGKVLKVNRLPVEKLKLVKSALAKARAGLVGVGLGAGLLIEEAVSGKAAEQIEESQFIPQMQEYIP